MSSYLIDQIAAIDNIEVRTRTTVLKCEGEDHLQCVTLVDTRRRPAGRRRGAPVRLHRRGAADRLAAATTVVRDRQRVRRHRSGPDRAATTRRGWDLDRDPYLLESSIPGVFVAGDVRAQSVKRVASAVGEGALAVTLVHRYLAEQ